jgi:hypothetical protein
MRVGAAVLAALFLASAAAGGEWPIRTPPTARVSFPVNADWRAHGGLECVLAVKGARPKQPLLASFYLQTKQDLWLKSREPLVLTAEPRTWRLRLDDNSPDWLLVNARRPYGRDLLRWIREWGVEVYSEGEFEGTLDVSAPAFQPAGDRPLEFVRLEAPSVASATERAVPIRFELSGFHGNPWSPDELVAQLHWKGEGGAAAATAYFRQDYTPIAGPDGDAPTLQPLGRPYWQVDWRPPRPGRYRPTIEILADRRRLSARLNAIAVSDLASPVQATPPLPAPGTSDAAFAHDAGDMRLLEYRAGRWMEVDAARRPRQVWRLPLDWTDAWGHYTGAGEYDPLLAWRFEQVVLRRTNDPLPIVVFDEDVLDDSGQFNWRDHPLNRLNGGGLDRPYDLFRDPRALANARDRAAYVWRRFGAMPGVSGLLLTANRPERVVTNWTDRFAAEFTQAYPSARLFCNNADLLPRAKSVTLDIGSAWNLDRRLTTAPADLAMADPVHIRLEATGTGSVGVVAQRIQHWVGADALTCDVTTEPNGARTLTAHCLIRTDPATVFQSRLVPLQEGEDNRLVFSLRNPMDWTCLQEPGRRPRTYDLLNVREVGLRFFCQEPMPIRATLGECRLLWPRAADWAKQPPLRIVDPKAKLADVPRFGKFEMDFDLNRDFNNPYDPEEIEVTLELTTPNGDPARHPAYFHEPWDLNMVRARETPVRGTGRPFWRVRYTPRVVGTYAWKLTARAGAERAQASGRFRCVPSASRGFVRVSEQDPRYLEFANGEFFFPIGLNLRSPGDVRGARFSPDAAINSEWAEKQGTLAYAQWFRKLRENGGNFARVWMSPWWCGLEWTPKHAGYHGVGYYNQANAERLDRLLALAEAEGIYLNLETINHGCLSTRVDADWHNSPYNLANPGGYVRSPVEFFGNARALKAHRNRLRYTVARWGYSAAIAWWGVITEAEWVQPYDRTIGYATSEPPPWLAGAAGFESLDTRSPKETYLKWISETAGYLRQTDAHPHLVSVHFSNPQNGTEVWRMPNLDVVQNNAYTRFATMWKEHEFSRHRGVVDVCRVFAQEYEPYRAGKPLIVCEWGGSPTENTERQLLAELHTGCWGLLMTPASGVTGYWWWNLLDAKNLYGNFRAVAAFMKGEDRRGLKWRSDRAKPSFPGRGGPDGSRERQGIVLYTKDQLFGYLYDEAINRYVGSDLATGPNDPAFPPTGEGTLELPGSFAPGSYRLEYWNTFAGEPIKTVPVVVTEENRRIPIPDHRVDIALKLKPAAPGK